jgi:hypothetical protein
VTQPSPFSNPKGAAQGNAPQIIQALLDLLGDLPPLDVLAETPQWLGSRLAGLSPARLRRAEAPGKWSVAAVLAHLADSELVIGTRSRFIVGDLEAQLPGFDQDRWAAEFHYIEADAAASLDLFSAVREGNLRHWRGLSPAQWQRVGHHSERGPTTAVLNLKIAAAHDLVHRRQIERILTVSGKG